MTDPADLILYNAQVITCDRSRPQAEAVAVKGGRILNVGSRSEIEQTRGPGTREIDCQQRPLTPGFIDAHCHFFALLRKFLSLDLSPAKIDSIEDIRALLTKKAKFTPAGNWISGTDYNEFYLQEKRHPTRSDLDAVSPLHPVFLIHRSLHACVLNSLGMRLTGINLETEEPSGGLIERDPESGEPNGLFYNMTGYIQERISQPLSRAEMDWAVRQVNTQFLSLGITSFCDATVTNDLERWQAFRRLKEEGLVRSRIEMLPGFDNLAEFLENGQKPGAGDDNLRLGNLKIVINAPGGQLHPAQADLNEMVLAACRSGFAVAIHAVEQAAVEAAATALEAALRQSRVQAGRQRIEHCSECPPVLRDRLANIQAVVVSQPPFIYYSGERYLAQVAPEILAWLYPFKSLSEVGVIVAGSSDSPVTFNNPLTGIYAAVTRKAESGEVVNPAERVSTQRALEIYTLNAAFASSQETIKGSISPGKLADLVLLSHNPLKVEAEGIKDIQVEMTLIGGEVVWMSPTASL